MLQPANQPSSARNDRRAQGFHSLCGERVALNASQSASPLSLDAFQANARAVLIITINELHACDLKRAPPLLHRPKLRVAAAKLEVLHSLGT
jgi:hypothetical protein